jgi:hypothetical protein
MSTYIFSAFFLVVFFAVLKAALNADYNKAAYKARATASLLRLYMLKFAFRYKVKSLLLLNQMAYSCRMYKKKPKKIEALCYLCNMRGGYLRCRRSRQIKVS